MNINHYDVLGVRTNASQQEIELAYKGRRTQYHPDKYSNTDEATLGWATEKMKDLNQAYEVLSDSQTRKEYDSVITEIQTNQKRSQEKPLNTSEKSTRRPPTFLEYLTSKIGQATGYERIYVGPVIPLQKRQGAYESHNEYLKSPADIAVVIDDTLFGGAKEGVAISNEHFMCKELGEESRAFRFAAIEQITTRKNSIYINDRKIIGLPLTNAAQLATIINALNEYIQATKGKIENSTQLTSEIAEQKLERAKERFRQLYKSLNQTEELDQIGDLAVDYFEGLDKLLIKQGNIYLVNSQAELIFALSDNAIEAIYGREEVNPELLNENQNDSTLVTVIRGILQIKYNEEAEATRKSRLNNFFN